MKTVILFDIDWINEMVFKADSAFDLQVIERGRLAWTTLLIVFLIFGRCFIEPNIVILCAVVF